MLQTNTVIKSMEDERDSLMNFLGGVKVDNEHVAVALILRVREIERELKFIKDAFH